jgi:diadenosine tetraphosphate (Ap4A) HIT family hydrolase
MWEMPQNRDLDLDIKLIEWRKGHLAIGSAIHFHFHVISRWELSCGIYPSEKEGHLQKVKW